MGIVTFFLGLFGGWRVFAGWLLTAFIGIIIYNVCCELVDQLLMFVTDKLTSTSVPGSATVQITGFAAWFLTMLLVPQMLSYAVTMVGIKWCLRKIPFIRW